MNRLKGVRFYLSGPMEFAPDGGVSWRKDIGDFLRSRGAIIIDPTDKPDGGPKETAEEAAQLKKWKENGEFQKVRDFMKVIRNYDRRYVDISDALIGYVKFDENPCGTWDEVFTADSQKKPVVFMFPDGLKNLSGWMFGTLPIELLHETWESVKSYLDYVDTSEEFDDLNRWRFVRV